MSPVVLAGAYFVVGLVCAALELRSVRNPTSRDLASAAVTLLVWPLWAPFALSPRASGRRRARGSTADPFGTAFALLWPAKVTVSGGEKQPRHSFLRALTALAALALLPGLFVLAFAVLAFGLHWTGHLAVGLVGIIAGMLGWVFRRRWARIALVAGSSLFFVPPLLRAVVARGTDGMRLTLLPDDRGTRFVNTLFPERDGCLFAAGMLGATGGLGDEEARDFHAILEGAYARVDTPSLLTPTPAIATYLGMQSPTAFDAIVLPPATGAKGANVTGAVVFLHGFAGNFHVYCWELAQAAGAANLLTVCPSLDQKAEWWTSRGDETLKVALRYLREQGIERVYLAGLSNGAAGASVLALRHASELSGLVLVSGMRAERPPALPVLVVQGSRDHMMPAAFARAYAKRSGRVRYHEVAGGHFVFLSKHELVRPAISDFLRATEAAR